MMADTEVLCVHGAWQGSWVWRRVLPILIDAGIRGKAIDLPGNGMDATPASEVSLQLYVNFVVSQMRPIHTKFWLIAHSGAGVIASQVAEQVPDRVAGILFLAGIMLPSGKSYADLVAEVTHADPSQQGISPFLEWSADRSTSRPTPEGARQIFFQDASDEDAEWAIRLLTPQPEGGRATRPTLTPSRFGRVRRVYVEALNDRSIPVGLQRRMEAALPGAESIALNTGHAPHLVAPGDVARIIISLLNSD
jgi:pimeloyl-ACP methyl ester carboxylesterase